MPVLETPKHIEPFVLAKPGPASSHDTNGYSPRCGSNGIEGNVGPMIKQIPFRIQIEFYIAHSEQVRK